MGGVSIAHVIESGRMTTARATVPTNRAAGRVLTHPAGLTPSSATPGEDLASMMPDRRHAFTERAAFMPFALLAGSVQ